jgi:hypothetical protein
MLANAKFVICLDVSYKKIENIPSDILIRVETIKKVNTDKY